MGENFFYTPPMTIAKHYDFLQVKQEYDIKEVLQSNMSFIPIGTYDDKIILFGLATDFLRDGQENNVNMTIEYGMFIETIKKAETNKFMAGFQRCVFWGLQTEDV